MEVSFYQIGAVKEFLNKFTNDSETIFRIFYLIRKEILEMIRFIFLPLLFFGLPFTCQQQTQKEQPDLNIEGEKSMQIKLTSPAFEEGGMIPEKFTCEGEDISPRLNWENIPNGTQTIALICDDPDAPMGTWVHWVIFNIPSTEKFLPENVATIERLDNGALQGRNDFRKVGYGGPCPPGGTHRYYFKIYALSSILQLKPGVSKKELLQAMSNLILAEGQLMGKYKR
jgi:Raf kinase inhibitor-like YbhB/YbcL family protein